MISDIAIVGAGVVGCAIARRFALEGASVLLLEGGSDILSGASKANSAILHTGFDAPAGSLELKCIQDGYAEYLEIKDEMGLPLLRSGALVVAWTEQEEHALEGIRLAAIGNGVEDVSFVPRKTLLQLEPNLSPNARAAIRVPRESLIDPWSPFLAYVEQAMGLGAVVRFKAKVLGGAFDGEIWQIQTSAGEFRAKTVINCAGNHGDHVDEMFLGKKQFEIKPRKGQFVVFDKAASRLISSIILPVPNERTKGVVVTRTIFGNLLVGPTAEEQDDRDHATVSQEQLEALVQKGTEILPALSAMPVTACYAGLRPATEKKDYRIIRISEKNFITVGGIRSTGLSAALGIALHVHGLYGKKDAGTSSLAPVTTRSMPNLAEHLDRDFCVAGYGEIVCHCELVTRREIETALTRPLPAGDIGGLKRRTRCMMGRCQGFNCSGKIAAITKGRLAVPLATGDL